MTCTLFLLPDRFKCSYCPLEAVVQSMNKFSLRTLLIGFSFIGLAFGALANATYMWAVVTLSVVVVLLLLTTVAAVISLGEMKAFCCGASIFGWAWLVLSYVPAFSGAIRPLAAADALVDIIYKQVQREVPIELGVPFHTVLPREAVPGNALTIDGITKMTYVMPVRVYFSAISQTLNALLFGFVGGFFGKWLFKRLNNEK